MARPKNLKKIVAALTDEEKAVMRELLKENPEVTQLKAKRAKLVEEIDTVDARLAELTGGKRKRPGRKPVVKTAPTGATPKRRGRNPKAVAIPTTTSPTAGVPVGDAVPAALPAPKIRRPRQPKRIIVNNDLIPPKD